MGVRLNRLREDLAATARRHETLRALDAIHAAVTATRPRPNSGTEHQGGTR